MLVGCREVVKVGASLLPKYSHARVKLVQICLVLLLLPLVVLARLRGHSTDATSAPASCLLCGFLISTVVRFINSGYFPEVLKRLHSSLLVFEVHNSHLACCCFALRDNSLVWVDNLN